MLLDIIHTEEQAIEVLQLINMEGVQALVRCVPTQDKKDLGRYLRTMNH